MTFNAWNCNYFLCNIITNIYFYFVKNLFILISSWSIFFGILLLLLWSLVVFQISLLLISDFCKFNIFQLHHVQARESVVNIFALYLNEKKINIISLLLYYIYKDFCFFMYKSIFVLLTLVKITSPKCNSLVYESIVFWLYKFYYRMRCKL